jgi:hypothetical protein
MVKILPIIMGIVALVCLLGAIRYLLVGYRECELPNIDDIEI